MLISTPKFVDQVSKPMSFWLTSTVQLCQHLGHQLSPRGHALMTTKSHPDSLAHLIDPGKLEAGL